MFFVSLQNLVRPAVNLRRISKQNRDKITNMKNKIYWNNVMFHGLRIKRKHSYCKLWRKLQKE